MSKGITHSCANIWRGIARPGGWWSLQRVATDWEGVFCLAEIEEHLATLKRGGFLASGTDHKGGTVYAYTAQCRPLPSEKLLAVTTSWPAAPPTPLVPPAQTDVMSGHYTPPRQTFRPGAMDYAQCPSLHMGQRRAFRSAA